MPGRGAAVTVVVMGSLAILVAGIAALFGVAALLNRVGDAKPRFVRDNVDSSDAAASATTVADLERELQITLPTSCAKFLQSPRPEYIDDVRVRTDLAEIVELTKEYRARYGGAKPWPNEFVFLGDLADACPFALNCSTGVVVQTDHGELNRNPLERFASFDEFVAALRPTDYEEYDDDEA